MPRHSVARAVAAILSISLLAFARSPMPTVHAAEPPGFRDMSGHWSAATVARAVADGYVSGYPDGTFRPDAQVTRAELLKLMVSAGRLPQAPYKFEQFEDVRGHWVEEQGYIDRALTYDVVDPSDFEGHLQPDQPATRMIATMMAVRLLGRQGGLQPAASTDVKVTDTASLPDWARPWVKQGLADGILTGYPDGSFRAQRVVTRAEAVALVQRTLAAMTSGVDPALRVELNGKTVASPVPLAVHDGWVYAPVKALYGGIANTSFAEQWTRQGVMPGNAVFQLATPQLEFPAGAAHVLVRTAEDAPMDEKPLAAPTYRLYGEVMLPAAQVGGNGSLPYLSVRHDPAGGNVLRVTQEAGWPGQALPASPEAAKLCASATSPSSPQVLQPGQVTSSLSPPYWCDAKGYRLEPAAPFVLTVSVDPAGPLRLRERADAPLVTQLQLRLQHTWEITMPQLFVPGDPAGPVAEGDFHVTWSASSGQKVTDTISVIQLLPYRLIIKPVGPGEGGKLQRLLVELVDKHDGVVGGPYPGQGPDLVITGPDGKVVPSDPPPGTPGMRWGRFGSIADFTWTPPRSGTYHLRAGLHPLDGTPDFHASTDITIP